MREHPMLQSLSRMPSDMSSDSRRQLLNAVTDLFLLDEEPSDAAKEHYGEIAIHSLGHLGNAERKQYADNVAAVPSLPHQVAVTLASDTDADVARLVLRLSPVLNDSDLAAIAVSQTQAHLLAIAERTRLSSGLTDILVERGNSAVLQTVSGNEGAEFSETGFDKLVERGRGDAAIGEALARRSDLTPDRAQRVLRIVNEVSGDSTDLARQARQQRRELRLLVADLQAGERKLDEVVLMLAQEDRAVHLAQLMASFADISNEQALRVLLQREVTGAAVLCRLLNLGTAAYRAVLELRGRRLYFAEQDLTDDIAAYAQLDKATAERTMRFLRLKTKVA